MITPNPSDLLSPSPVAQNAFDVSARAVLPLLQLMDSLADCADIKQILERALPLMHDLFGDWSCYTVLLSDGNALVWRTLSFCNPLGTQPSGLSLIEMPSDTDIDTMAERFGRNVSREVRQGTFLLPLLLADSDSTFLTSQDWNPDAHRETTALLPGADDTGFVLVLGAVWARPAGGRGCVLLGYGEGCDSWPIAPGSTLPTLAQAVKIITRLSFYPGFRATIERLERESHSLRRNIVHDLKTPVAIMKGFAEMLQQPEVGNNPALRQELLDAIREQSDRLLDDLKDLLHPMDAAWTPQWEEVDIALLLAKTVMSERHTERSRNHRFQMLGADNPVWVRADRRKIRRVLENLLSNAVKYSPGEDKPVYIALHQEDGTVRIAFTDAGIGMTAEQLTQVMTTGGRVADSGLGIEGSGFGLDSCRRVLEAHGGSLEAVSEFGVGSTFTLTLPVR